MSNTPFVTNAVSSPISKAFSIPTSVALLTKGSPFLPENMIVDGSVAILTPKTEDIKISKKDLAIKTYPCFGKLTPNQLKL